MQAASKNEQLHSGPSSVVPEAQAGRPSEKAVHIIYSEVELCPSKHCLPWVVLIFHQSACLQAPLLCGPLFQCSVHLQVCCFFSMFLASENSPCSFLVTHLVRW